MVRGKEKIIAIVGPTAVGKSVLAVKLAKHFGGEVISADSRQVYRGLDIGTGKLTRGEMRGVPHHLLDVTSPKKQFTVSDFKKLAEKSLDDMYRRGRLPILVGGTGLYIDTLLGKFTIPEVPPNPALRKRLEKKSVDELFAMLRKRDPKRASVIDPENPRRLIRAIEIAKAIGSVPVHAGVLENNRMKNALWIGLTLPKKELQKRIAKRLTARLTAGMVAEAKRLQQNGLSWRRMEALGLEYRYLARRLQGKLSRDEMVRQLSAEIRQYAKRQMTWFRKNKEIRWFKPSETNKMVALAKTFLRA